MATKLPKRVWPWLIYTYLFYTNTRPHKTQSARWLMAHLKRGNKYLMGDTELFYDEDL